MPIDIEYPPQRRSCRSRAGIRSYERVNGILAQAGFDDFVEALCEPFYCDAGKGGRLSIAPGVYFRMLLAGYLEGIDSERGIAWRVPVAVLDPSK